MMDKERIYLSGPISGLERDKAERNFSCAESFARIEHGEWCEVFSPLGNGLAKEAPYWEHMRTDIMALLRCSRILMLPGWERSQGCITEHRVATSCGIEIEYISKDSAIWKKALLKNYLRN